MPDPEKNSALLGRRLGAMLYDWLALFAILMVATAILTIFTQGEALNERDPLILAAYRSYILIISFTFFAFFWVRGGQTLGMRAWKIKLVSRTGKPITLMQAFLRFLAAIPSTLIFGLGLVWSLWDKEKLAWHDRFSETRIVRKVS